MKLEMKKWNSINAINYVKKFMEDDENEWALIHLEDESCVEEDSPYAVVRIEIFEGDELSPTWNYNKLFEFLSEEDKNEFVEFMK